MSGLTVSYRYPEDPHQTAKGWRQGVIVNLADGRAFELAFYDTTRFHQTVLDDVAREGVFAEPNAVVIEQVTSAAISRTVEKLFASENYVRSLVPMG